MPAAGVDVQALAACDDWGVGPQPVMDLPVVDGGGAEPGAGVRVDDDLLVLLRPAEDVVEVQVAEAQLVDLLRHLAARDHLDVTALVGHE